MAALSVETRPVADVISDYLLKQIAKGSIGPGEKLPSRASLAKRFEVSPATVSTAVNKLSAQGLVKFVPGKGLYLTGINQRRKRTFKVGLIGWYASNLGSSHALADLYWQGIFRSLTAEGARQKISIIPLPGLDTLPINIEEILDYEVDAVVTHGIRLDMETVRRLRACGIPLVLGNCYLVEDGVSHVDYDNMMACRQAVKFFAEHGHRRIAALLGQTSIHEVMDECRRAFFEELDVRDCHCAESLWCVFDKDAFTGRTDTVIAAIRSLLSRPDPPTAFYCWGKYLEKVVVEVAEERGFQMGKDIGIITCASFGDESPFTNILADHDLLAEKLLDACQTVARDPLAIVQVDVPNKFVDKGSVPVLAAAGKGGRMKE